MPLLRNGQLTDDDRWIRIDDNDPLPASGTPTVVSLARLQALHDEAQGASVSGVFLAPDDDPGLLAPWLHELQLICIEFPMFTDGRGYSHARILRQRLSFAGELRAVGDVRPDQIAFMARVGIDSFAFAQAPDIKLVKRLLTHHKRAYQPSYPLAIAG